VEHPLQTAQALYATQTAKYELMRKAKVLAGMTLGLLTTVTVTVKLLKA
jgi:hypothetical protein